MGAAENRESNAVQSESGLCSQPPGGAAPLRATSLLLEPLPPSTIPKIPEINLELPPNYSEYPLGILIRIHRYAQLSYIHLLYNK